jgi:hypothetical protein
LLAKHAEWLGVLVKSRPESYLEQMLKTLSGTSVEGQSEQNRQDLADWIDQRLPEELRGEERRQVIEAVLEKSGGTFLYLSLVERDKTLSLADPKGLPDKLDGFFKQTFNRYFPDPEAYGKKTEPFLRLMVAAPGPLPAEMGRQILGWSQRELTLNVIDLLGSLLQELDGGLVFFHASLSDWLKDPKRSGTHCVEGTGIYDLADFLWQDRDVASRGHAINEDGFTETWVTRSVWLKQLIRPGYSPRFWLNMIQQGAKEVANTKGELAREVEFARRLVSLTYEAWGGEHDIFQLAKMEWEDLKEHLRNSE